MSPPHARILLVNDGPNVLLAVQEILQQENYEGEAGPNGEPAVPPRDWDRAGASGWDF